MGCSVQTTRTRITTTTTYYPLPAPVIKYVEVPTTDNGMEMELFEEQEEEAAEEIKKVEPVAYNDYEDFQGFDEPAAFIGEEE